MPELYEQIGAAQLYRLTAGYRAGYVTEMELQQGRKLLMDLLWWKFCKWMASYKCQISKSAVLRELGQVILAWLRREGDLPGLLAAWWDVASGRVLVGDEV